MNTTAAIVILDQDKTAKTAGIVYVDVCEIGGRKLIEQIIVKDGADVVKLADQALNAKGYFRFSGYSMVQGEMTAAIKF
jgi:hypothetical protein